MSLNIFRKVLRRFLILVERDLSYLVPKKRTIWVYYPTHFRSVAGNIKAVFDYVRLNNTDIQQYILEVGSQGEYFGGKSLEYKNYIISRFSLKGMYLTLRAKVIFLDSGNFFSRGKFNVVQLWHGTGYKNIHATKNESGQRNNYKNIVFIPASSAEDKKRKEKSFLSNNVYLTGSPRNDFFFKKNSVDGIKSLKIKFGLSDFNKVFCYAPTFRDKGRFNPFSQSFFEKIQMMAQKHNYAFVIKSHPSDSGSLFPKKFPNIIDGSKLSKDVHPILLISDLLITDYSGISSDYSLLRKPIIFYMYDYEEYVNNSRDFYYNIKEVLPGPFAYTEERLLELLESQSWFYSSQYQQQFHLFLKFFHQYEDNESCKRVVEQVCNYIRKEK